MYANYEMESDLHASGHAVIVGIDEVGRGALAGPLVAAAVVLPNNCQLNLQDSKKLSRARRNLLVDDILACADDFGVGSASHVEIDQFGLSIALRMAFVRALEMLDHPFSIAILDGTHNAIGEDFVICRAKADADVACVAAASIVAKVYRDELMRDCGEIYPEYGFGSHVGYGTEIHRKAIETYGPSPWHRHSFGVG